MDEIMNTQPTVPLGLALGIDERASALGERPRRVHSPPPEDGADGAPASADTAAASTRGRRARRSGAVSTLPGDAGADDEFIWELGR
jgi:hypothetical protein